MVSHSLAFLLFLHCGRLQGGSCVVAMNWYHRNRYQHTLL